MVDEDKYPNNTRIPRCPIKKSDHMYMVHPIYLDTYNNGGFEGVVLNAISIFLTHGHNGPIPNGIPCTTT